MESYFFTNQGILLVKHLNIHFFLDIYESKQILIEVYPFSYRILLFCLDVL